MRTFRLAARLYKNNLFLLLTYLLGFAATAGFAIFRVIMTNSSIPDLLDTMRETLRLSFFVFLLMAFLAYEYFYKAKTSSVYECARATQRGLQRLYGAQLCVMLCLALLLTAVPTLLNVIYYCKLDGAHGEYLLHILLNMVLNLLLVAVFGILLGCFASLLANRLKAYLLMSAFVLLSTPVCEIFVTMITQASFNAYPFYNFFNIFPPLLSYRALHAFGFSVLPQRFALILFWCCLAGAGVLYALGKRRGSGLRVGAGVCAVLCAVCFSLYCLPASVVVMNEDPDHGPLADSMYYYRNWDNVEENGTRREAAGFAVTQYTLDVRVYSQLSVRATLKVDKADLKAYRFTLYHAYKVTQVRDQTGAALPFTQEGDYITVDNARGRQIESLELTYAGAAPRYYTNAQGINLPGQFPYYPHAGFSPMINPKDQQALYPFKLKQATPFAVTVRTTRKVYCNLPQTGENTFAGESDALTLIGGMYDTLETNGITVVYPYLNLEEFTKEKIEQQVAKYRAQGSIPEQVKQIFIVCNTNLTSPYERCGLFVDHITVNQLLSYGMDYPFIQVNPSKVGFWFSVNQFESNPSGYWATVEENSKMNPNWAGGDGELMAQKIKKLGDKAFLEKAKAYIEDDEDTRTEHEFLTDL